MDRYPLRGIRVVDFSWVLAGPMATRTLALMGAEVIKVESATRPEYARRDGHFPLVNNNKRSCTINITKEAGQDLVRRLVAKSNILVENFSVRVLKKYRLSYEDLKPVRPDLIYVSASGLGRTGPENDALAYGTLLQAYSGRSRMIGEFNPRLEGMGVTGWTDPITSLWESFAILAAILNHRRTGAGAYIDLSMLEATVALLPHALLQQALPCAPEETRGLKDIGAAPSGSFRCKGVDAWIAVSVHNDVEWRALCSVIDTFPPGASAWDGAERTARKGEISDIISSWLEGLDADHAERVLLAAGVPAARARNFGEVADDGRLAQRGVFVPMPDGSRTTGLQWRDGDGWTPEVNPSPRLGQDNDYVFGTLLGLPKTEIERLVKEEVIQ